MLAPHLLRRVKEDVMKELPPKKELILRVELSSKRKEYYKTILTHNYQILTRKGGAQISLINVVMELHKLCCHPFMLEVVEPEDTNEFTKQLLESSGKLQLLDKMMVRLKEQGHRVLVGANVILKGIITLTNVAQGIAESLNPTKLLGNGELLGHEWCGVKVTVTTEYEESFIIN